MGGVVLVQIGGDMGSMEAKDGRKVNFYMVIPAYREEIEYKLEYGMEALDKRFSEGNLQMCIRDRKEDLEHLESYLTILKRRFGERFRCRIDVEPEAMDLRIPKLVLQPMIENAVKYGFGKQLNLTVELKAYILSLIHI